MQQIIGSVVTNSRQQSSPRQSCTVFESVSFRYRTMSSLRRPADSNHYVLLDAVCRVFFPHQHSVDGFIRAIETLFHIPEVQMSDDEEHEFINFYRLPTDRLRYNKLIRLDLLAEIFPRLDMMFSADVDVTKGQLIGTAIPRAPRSSGRAAKTTTVTTTNNNDEDEDVARPRKRRRNMVCSDVVVIDWQTAAVTPRTRPASNTSIGIADIRWLAINCHAKHY